MWNNTSVLTLETPLSTIMLFAQTKRYNKDLRNNTQSHILSEWSISGQFQDLTHLKTVSIELYCTLLCSCLMPQNGWKGGGPAMQCHIFAMVLAITHEDTSRVQEHCNSNLLLHFLYYLSSNIVLLSVMIFDSFPCITSKQTVIPAAISGRTSAPCMDMLVHIIV